MRYVGRPGLSPVTATLIAMGWIRRQDRILDVGCGTGTEAVLLASWGSKHVVGIDTDRGAIRIARGRATRKKLGKRLSFEVLDARDLPSRFKRGHFHVALHTLVANNLPKDEVEAHFQGIRNVMDPDGLLIVQERVSRRHENGPPDALAPLEGLTRWFDVTPGVSTHLPEEWAPGYARIVLWIGRPR